ncbi:MAG: prepilin-type N-terminal cleavage/methylation domain-containing protein [Dissulfurispiraceae bacterium]|jgi:prepilin-type N-terminal cleavage/methylation domain-containing protein
MKGRNGFTLLEIMIVLFLITLVMGLSAVFFANALPSHKLNASVREMSSTIRRAHMLAQVSGSRQTLSIDLDARTYGIDGRGYKSFDPDITVRVLDPLTGESRTGIHSLIFQASGGIQGETIILGARKREVKIEVDPVVGSVIVK